MESILARALEYTLKYWLKSFTRDQFKLQGRVVQLSNLDINGDALHASVGLPPALSVTTARVGKLEIKLPYVSNVQTEPIVVQIDRLDLVLEENSDSHASNNSNSSQSLAGSKGSGYGFADRIADGMTLEVGVVNLMLETRGGAQSQAGATWVPPLASMTIRELLLYTTNEKWQVVNLKESRDFSHNKKFIYVFKKLEWGSLSVDLLPHPDMFSDGHLTISHERENKRDEDGAKRLFFGGERFLEGISGHAYITVQRTEQNCPLGLEVQLHVTEAVCPALSEPGLRALLRFLTGLYVCLNRGDVDPNLQQHFTEAAGRSLVSIIVDHIFLCIKDADFRLELLMQSLFFSRASVSNGESTRNLSRIMVAGFFLRDTASHPPRTLVQPSMETAAIKEPLHVPEFGKNFCPPIYPLGGQIWEQHEFAPLFCLHSLQITPSPLPPLFASQTVIDCQPLMINLLEETCLRIASFLADGIKFNPGAVLPDFSVSSLEFSLKEFDLAVPLDATKLNFFAENADTPFENSFSGARLHVEDLMISQSPRLKLKLLNLDKDPVCFSLWEGQQVDASQKKWTMQVSLLCLSLETNSTKIESKNFATEFDGLWKCVELHEAFFETAMVTADGSPLIILPPPGGIVRIGVACLQYLSNTSVQQLFYILDLYAYFGRIGEEISKIRKNKTKAKTSLGGSLMEMAPSDTVVTLAMNYLQLKFMELSPFNSQGMPLVQFLVHNFFVKVSHRTFSGAMAVSSTVSCDSAQVDSVDAEVRENDIQMKGNKNFMLAGNEYSQMRTVFWIDHNRNQLSNGVTASLPFLDISTVHMIAYNVQDMECNSLSVSAKVAGVRLGGGMNYSEALLHRFGILGPDGGPGEGLSRGLKYLSAGPLSKLLRTSLTDEMSDKVNVNEFLEFGNSADVDLSLKLENWLFSLEGTEDIAKDWSYDSTDIHREERCWHASFESLQMKAKSTPKTIKDTTGNIFSAQKYPIESIIVGVDGLRVLKPHLTNDLLDASSRGTNQKSRCHREAQCNVANCGGVNIEVCMVSTDADESTETMKWVVEKLKFSVKQPIEAVATKGELEHLALLCRSEVDSMGRIIAGILRILKLDKSIGQAAIDQLSNLGSDGLDGIFTPEKSSRRNSVSSVGYSSFPDATPNHSAESTVASLEAAVSDLQTKCSTLLTESFKTENTILPEDIKQLNQELENMQLLLMHLRTQM